jgi:hypothetical protein
VAVVVGLSLARPVSALECMFVPLETSMKEAEIVLLGRIDAVRFNMVSADSASHSIVTITVTELWKGTTPRAIELHQPFIGGGINFWTETRQDYVLFVRKITPERPLLPVHPNVTSGFLANECISKPATLVDLKALGPGRAPEP